MSHAVTVEILSLLALIIIANGSPVVIRYLLKHRFDLAIDLGQSLPDGQRIFGDSKTWRGLIAAVFFTAVAAYLMGYSPQTGMLVALYALLGDLISSFLKRRLAMPSSSMALLLDQVPESFLPAFMLMDTFNLDIMAVIALVLIFIILELLLSRILYRWGLRKRPY